MIKTIGAAAVLTASILMAGVTPTKAGTLGCLVGAVAGGAGGAQIGKGRGKLIATGLGTLLGCGAGNAIQNSDIANAQPRYQQPQNNGHMYQGQTNAARYERRAYGRNARPIYRSEYEKNHRLRHYQQRRAQPVSQASYCPYSREYQTTVTVGGRTVPAYGQACSHDGGKTWKFGAASPSQ